MLRRHVLFSRRSSLAGLLVVAVALLMFLPSTPGLSRDVSPPSHRPTPVPEAMPRATVPSLSGVALPGTTDAEPLGPLSAGSVERTIFVNYNTTTHGNFPSAVWDWVAGTAVVDPQTGEMWVPEYPMVEDGIRSPSFAPALVYNTTTNSTSFDRNLDNTSALAWDPVNELFYATNPLTNSVLIFNPRTDALVGPPIPVGSQPDAIVYDPDSQDLFVANYGSSNVTILNGTTNAFVSKGVAIGTDPTEFADDTTDHLVYVAGSTEVSVISTKTEAAQLPILLAAPASSIAYSKLVDEIAVTEPSSAFMLIYSGATEGGVAPPADVGVDIVSVVSNPNGSEYITTNDSADSLSIVNSTTRAISATHPTIQGYSSRLSIDPYSGVLIAWSGLNRTFTVLDPDPGVEIQFSPDLGARLEGLAYDTASNRVFAVDVLTDTISILDASTMTTAISPVRLPGLPNSVADDEKTGVVYAGYAGGVLAIDAQTGEIVATNASIPGNNSELLVDSGSGLLWDDNGALGLIALHIPTLTLAERTAYSAGRFNLEGLTLDPATDVLYFVDTANASVVALNGAGGPLPEAPAPVALPDLISLAYDGADNAVYALGASVWVLDPATLAIEAGPIPVAPHTVAWTITYDPDREYLYVTSNSSDEPWPGNVTVLDGASVSASSGAYVTIPAGQLPLVALPVELPGGTAAGDSEIWVTNFISGTISVLASPPEISSFAAIPDPVDVGALSNFTLDYSGGAGPSTVAYTGLPSGCPSANSTSIACTAESPGTYNVTAVVTDSLGSAAAAFAILSVAPQLVVTPSYLGPVGGQLDLQNTLSASANVAGGVGPFNYSWNFGDGQVAWGPSVSATYPDSGSYAVTVVARDAGGGVAVNTTGLLVVDSPQVAERASPSNVTDVGRAVELAAQILGGTSPGSGTWEFGDGHSQPVTGLSPALEVFANHTYNESGVYFAEFNYTDSSGVTASQTVQVVVHAALSATISVATAPPGDSLTPGTLFDFNTTISGGTAPFTVVWGFDDGSFAYGISAQHAYASPGTYTVTLFVVDAVGASTNVTYRLAVTSASSGSAGGISFDSGLLLGILVGAALGTVILLFAGRRSRRPPPPAPPTAYVPPAPPEEGPAWRET